MRVVNTTIDQYAMEQSYELHEVMIQSGIQDVFDTGRCVRRGAQLDGMVSDLTPVWIGMSGGGAAGTAAAYMTEKIYAPLKKAVGSLKDRL